MKRKLYRLGVITLIIVEVIFVNLSIKSFVNKGKEIEQVNYNDAKEIDTSNMFAYYIDNGNGQYTEETDRTEWPDSNNYTYIKSVCHDGDGNDVISSDVVTFDGNTFTANVSTATTMYCNVYFIKTGTPLATIEGHSGSKGSGTFEEDTALQTRNSTIGDVKDDLRRFVGEYTTVIDNFICFGTYDETGCKENMDTYMYRIIGIDTNNRLKVIKATKIVNDSTNTFAWNSNYYAGTEWNASDLYNGLNDRYFMSNTKYNYMQQEQWTNLISPATYYIGDSTDTTNPNLFINERKNKFDNGNISLMYLSDYLYANNGTANTDNWLFIQNGLNGSTTPSAEVEWTMTRYGYYGTYNARVMSSNGTVSFSGVHYTWAVRPVFYLKSDIKIAGLGTIEQPYIISNSSLVS